MKLRNCFRIWVMLTALAIGAKLYAQQPMRIQIVQAGMAMHSSSLGAEFVHFVGSPIFEHEGAYLYCDSAMLNEVNNSVECFGNVRIKSSDTLNIYGKYMQYDGITRMGLIRDNVKLVDKESTLSTDVMFYDRNTGVASYTTGGKIVNGDNTLTSQKGFYHTNEKEMFFRDNVVLTNPDYKINCDTLKYNTVSRTSYFMGPTIIKGKDNYIYCENGEYNRTSNRAKFSVNALLVDKDRRLNGDSLYYDEKLKFGRAVNNVTMIDTVKDVIVRGNYAEYWKQKGFAMVTQKALAAIGDEKDTLYMHADTLRAVFDTANNNTKELFAWYKAKFFRKDFQGACDSLHYSMADSLITMYKLPVMWSDKNQLTADTILVHTGKSSVKLMEMNGTAFIASHDTIDNYNQIKGRNMIGRFKDNKLTTIDVNGNAETVYFVREDDKKNLIGVNQAKGSKMRIYMVESKMDHIVYLDKPEGNMQPDKDVLPEQRKLKGFAWHSERRPANKNDVFNDTLKPVNNQEIINTEGDKDKLPENGKKVKLDVK